MTLRNWTKQPKLNMLSKNILFLEAIIWNWKRTL